MGREKFVSQGMSLNSNCGVQNPDNGMISEVSKSTFEKSAVFFDCFG